MKTLAIPSTGTKIDYITIKFTGGRAIGRLNRSSIHTATVPYSSFSHRLSAIHRAGGRVISVSMPHELRSEIGLTEVTTAKVVEPVAKKVAEPVIASVMEVLAEEIATETEAIAVETPELAVETIVEPVIEPVAELIPEPVIEAITEPVVEPVAETVAEPIAGLAVEPELSIKSKKPRASGKSSGFAKPKVDTAAKATRSPRKPKS